MRVSYIKSKKERLIHLIDELDVKVESAQLNLTDRNNKIEAEKICKKY